MPDYGNLLGILPICLSLTMSFNFQGTWSEVCKQQATLEARIEFKTPIPEDNITGIVWTRPTDGQFVVICNPMPTCNPTAGYEATVELDQNSTMLTILNVKLHDVGDWRIENAKDSAFRYPVCELRAASIPTCSIQSELDTDALDVGTEVSLSINITDYYCTKMITINITTGNLTEEILSHEAMSDLLNNTSVMTFNVTSDHFGDVGLMITCDEVLRKLTCDGVQRLLQRMTSVETTTSVLTTHQETFGSSEFTTNGVDVVDDTGSDNTIDVAIIVGIVAGCVLLLIIILMIVFRDNMKKTYKYIVSKNKDAHTNIVMEKSGD